MGDFVQHRHRGVYGVGRDGAFLFDFLVEPVHYCPSGSRGLAGRSPEHVSEPELCGIRGYFLDDRYPTGRSGQYVDGRMRDRIVRSFQRVLFFCGPERNDILHNVDSRDAAAMCCRSGVSFRIRIVGIDQRDSHVGILRRNRIHQPPAGELILRERSNPVGFPVDFQR